MVKGRTVVGEAYGWLNDQTAKRSRPPAWEEAASQNQQ